MTEIIEQEIRHYVEKETNLRREERVQYLMAIYRKHFTIDSLEHSIDYHDFMAVVGQAVAAYPKSVQPFRISGKEVHSTDSNHVLIIEAFVSYLNRHAILRRLVKFNFTR